MIKGNLACSAKSAELPRDVSFEVHGETGNVAGYFTDSKRLDIRCWIGVIPPKVSSGLDIGPSTRTICPYKISFGNIEVGPNNLQPAT